MSNVFLVEQTAKKRCDFFFIVWLEEFLFHCLEYSNEIELKRQQIRKKNSNNKTGKFQLMKSVN